MVNALHRVQSENFVLIAEPSYLTAILKAESVCDVEISSDTFFKSNYAFPTNKQFPYLEMFNNRLVIDLRYISLSRRRIRITFCTCTNDKVTVKNITTKFYQN